MNFVVTECPKWKGAFHVNDKLCVGLACGCEFYVYLIGPEHETVMEVNSDSIAEFSKLIPWLIREVEFKPHCFVTEYSHPGHYHFLKSLTLEKNGHVLWLGEKPNRSEIKIKHSQLKHNQKSKSNISTNGYCTTKTPMLSTCGEFYRDK